MYKGKLLTGAVLSVFMAGAYGNACAADGTSDAVYSLNPVVVTATRYEKSDAEIPAATQTFTEEQIEQTGADNLQVALQYLDGVIDAGMGPNGTSVSSMTTKNVIRGVSNGTVVMINGTPINWRTNYNLENIPTSAVERVEVVRGGGAVLYGSQATGGVINIITKKTLPNEVKVGLGNKGRQEYAVTANAGDLSIAYTYNKWGKLGYVSSSDSSIKPDKTRVPVEMKQRFFGSEKNDFLATYKLNDHADFLYNHNESASRWAYTYTGITDPDYEDMNDHPRYIRRYENDKDFLQFNFHGLDGISGHVFYNYNTLKTHGTDYYSSTGKKYAAPKAVRGQEKNKTYGYDVQKVWDGNPDQTFLIGTSLVRETFENETSDTGRNIISAFGSWERNLTAKDVLTLSGRGTWTTGGIQNFHNFSGQAQYLHKLDNTQSLYASVGQSFVLPTFSQMYSREQAGGISNIIGNPDLKPQKGLHYEAGWKKEETNRQYKVALFTEKIDDNISYSGTSGRWYTINEDFKNHGIEASIRGQEDNGFTWHAGLTWQDPKSKQTTEKTSAKRYWDRSYGRILLTGGVGYEKEKWTTALNFSYLADRVQSPLAAHSHSVKPYLLTSMTVKYSPNKSSDIMLAIDNLLNRKDIVSHTTSDYYATPRNFILSYRYKF
ncbi:MAG TPA: TonB-dependent receptor [Veillonellaceae bacterium]|jgi:vitamin B12 transporter|uniref:TonB-dependent receptor plug domain-containing protein n=1 Tax=Dialister hominis TaxID=2582419 RepID=UPI00265EC07F|nr:TonB-dependent receptor [uncultured Dialister sp.]HJI41691.1 TonB-dependent receptor [Veillonellaceae bacterium]